MKIPAPIANQLAQASPRERRMLTIAAGVVALALLLSLFDAILKQQDRLAAELPRARAQLARMQAEAAELERLKPVADTAAPPALNGQIEALQAAARSRGLGLEITTDGEGIKASGNAAFPALLDWLASVQADQHLRPARMVLQAQGEVVAVDLGLEPADR